MALFCRASRIVVVPIANVRLLVIIETTRTQNRIRKSQIAGAKVRFACSGCLVMVIVVRITVVFVVITIANAGARYSVATPGAATSLY